MKTVEEKALNEIEKQQNEAGIAFLGAIQLEVPEFNAVKNALEKQIPKHIEEQTEEDREFIDYVCPNCKTTLQQKHKQAKRTTIYKYKHCIFCGQSLDWSNHPAEKGGESDA